MKSIYIVQYGYWWKLSPEQWREICRQGASGEGYCLPPSGQRKRRPKAIGVTNYGSGKPSYFSLRDDSAVFQPLDWSEEDFQEQLDDLSEVA